MSQNLPLVTELVSLDNLTLSSFSLDDVALDLLSKVHYKNLIIDRNASNSTGFYSLTLVTFNNLGFELPGLKGMKLVLNPSNVPSGGSEIDFSFNYSWHILKYLKNFNNLSFIESVDEVFSMYLNISGLSKVDFISNLIIESYGNIDKIQDFVDDYNLSNNDGLSLTVDPSNLDIYSEIVNVINQFDSNGVNLFTSLFGLFIRSADLSQTIDNLKNLGRSEFGDFSIEKLREFIRLNFSFQINEINVALEFPRNYLRPIFTGYGDFPNAPAGLTLGESLPEPYTSKLSFNVGSISYNSNSSLKFNSLGTFSLQESFIGNTEFSLLIDELEVDLSRDKNISAANEAGYDEDFVGVFIKKGTIGFPQFWNHDNSNSTGQIVARNLLVGTGGISGTLGLEAKTAGNSSPLISANFGGGFQISLDAFDITFQQNAIIGSNISGSMRIPKFEDANGNPAEIGIDIHIGQDGDFSVTAKEPDGIPIRIPNVMQFNLTSASIGREDDRFYLSVSGSMEFIHPTVASLFPAEIEFQEIIIWNDGQFEIKGGGLELPQALSLKFPPVELSVTAIHLGSTERDYDDNGTNVLRKYKYFGFDGSVKVDPGGVEAKGKGIQVYFSTDNDNLPLDIFIRIESIRIDIIIPGDVDPKDASVIIAGFLSMKEPPAGLPGTEYAGGISIDLPQAGIGGSAAMRFNPKVPYFIIDLEVEISKAIPLGSTGLGLYGFRGLVGKYFVATKNAAGVADSEPWWKYYKAKVDPDYKEGVQISKFDPKGGFALGLGVSLATATDSGKVFSSKIFLLLSLRELFMLQGQAAILSERIKLNDPNDPPFFALIVITRESIEAALGVNYLIPDDKDPGSIAAVQGVLELGFFFRDSSAWYLNIGRDLPESYRIQVRLLDLFDVYFYFMLNARGIRTGAGARFEVDKKFGPLRAYLHAYLDVAAKVAFKPKQFGGSIALGGGVDLSIFGLGFSVSAAASLAAEAPEPFIVTGSVEACIRVLRKDRCAKFEFTWDFNDNVDTSEVGLINRSELGSAAQAINIQTKETFPVNFVKESSNLVYRGGTNPSTWLPPDPSSPAWKGSFDDYIIPLDCFVDIDFMNGMNPNGNASTNKFGKNGGANFTRYVAPQKGKTPRVKHDFVAEDIFIYAWNPTLATWEEYDIYEALTPMDDLPFIDPAVIDSLDLKQGYWQMEEANKYNKLRLLAQTPLSYMTQTSGEFIPENNGITSETIFCEEEPREKCCVNFSDYLVDRKKETIERTVNFTAVIDTMTGPTPVQSGSTTFPVTDLTTIPVNEIKFFRKFSFKVTGGDGSIVQTDITHLGHNIALAIEDNDSVEITFSEPMASIDFTMFTLAQSVTVEYYQLVIDNSNPSGINVIEQQLPHVDTFTAVDLNSVVQYQDPNNAVDKIIIRNGVSSPVAALPTLCDPEMTMEGQQLEVFLGKLAERRHLLFDQVILNDGTNNATYDGVFMSSPLYQYPGGVQIPVYYQLSSYTASSLSFVVKDNNNYECFFSLVAGQNINWNDVKSMSNLRPDGQNLSQGTNMSFLIDVTLNNNTVITIEGTTSCYGIIQCTSQSSTYIYKLCFYTEEDFAYNQTIPDAPSVAAETDSMMDAIEKTFQPIWRPNTTYAVAIKTNEAVSGGGSNNHRNTFYYGFRTKGPIGHFHNYLDNNNNEVIREDYQQLLDSNQEDSYKLSKLQHYIDYRRSYPNADGNLLNAKPLFYLDPKLLLFFKKQYAYAMFGNWDPLSGNGQVNGDMDIVIQDSIEPAVPPVPTLSWKLDNFSILGKDVLALGNMIANSDPTECPPDSMSQNSVNAQVDIDQLKPLKLYTAIFSNTYQRDADAVNPSTPNTTREVHRYPFRTSRYGNFEEQVNSYQLAVDPITTDVLKQAIFDVEKVVPSASITSASGMISNTPTNDLLQEYADLIERVLQGAFKLGTLQPAISTEFNLVRNIDTNGNLLGIWIRCPEPFNDPKLPKAQMLTTIRLSVDSDNESNYKAIFSKDAREVFITRSNNSFVMPSGEYSFTFDYREWDGQQYVTAQSVPVIFTVGAAN